ncbi:MAG: hypothetical protein ACUVYA_06115 [Planctomycetota bacterium]
MERTDLDGRPRKILNNPAGLARQAQVTLYELPGRKVILKEWKPAGGAALRWWSRFCIRREVRNYQRLAGIPGIPRVLEIFDDRSFLLEYVEAEPIRRDLPHAVLVAALDSLDRLLDEIHARRFVHLDVRASGNVLVDREGKAWLIDLVQGLDCSKGLLRRAVFPILRRIDRSALRKYRARYAPETLDPKIRDRAVAKYSRHRRNWSPLLGRWLIGLFARGDRTRASTRGERGDGR